MVSTISTQTKSTNLGGPFPGFSAKQTVLNYKDGQQTTTRFILRTGWNTAYAKGTYNGRSRVTTPFRAVNNAGDFLSRKKLQMWWSYSHEQMLYWVVWKQDFPWFSN